MLVIKCLVMFIDALLDYTNIVETDTLAVAHRVGE